MTSVFTPEEDLQGGLLRFTGISLNDNTNSPSIQRIWTVGETAQVTEHTTAFWFCHSQQVTNTWASMNIRAWHSKPRWQFQGFQITNASNAALNPSTHPPITMKRLIQVRNLKSINPDQTNLLLTPSPTTTLLLSLYRMMWPPWRIPQSLFPDPLPALTRSAAHWKWQQPSGASI